MKASWIAALVCGALFGVGLAISGMTRPAVVIGFLDVGGAWNPTLLFVLGGAVAVTAVAFRFVLRLPQPLWEAKFHLAPTRAIDGRLLAGAAIFGVGWGLLGFCPGPALVALASGAPLAIVFVVAMLVGSGLARLVAARGIIR